jgi:hypothetical protein
MNEVCMEIQVALACTLSTGTNGRGLLEDA